MISPVMMRLIPGRRYGVLPHLRRHGEPLPCPNESEREGYVPNVVHTCGALLHGHELIVPLAMNDSAARFATVPLDELLAAME